MQTKLFEIRDRMTFIPAMAVRICYYKEPRTEDRYLIVRSGFAREESYVMLAKIYGDVNPITCDPHHHGSGTRTMPTAHKYIIDNWDSLESGSVIDVEYILGETTTPKQSERLPS